MKIQFEGIDGAGKTDQVNRLADRIEAKQGKRPRVTKEFEASQYSRDLRGVLHSECNRSQLAEMFTFLAIKSEFYSQPKGSNDAEVCILDRGWLSFLAPTVVSTGISPATLGAMLDIATQGESYPVTILIDTNAELAQERLVKAGKRSRFDRQDIEVYRKQRAAFLELVNRDQPHLIVDGAQSIEVIADQIWDFLLVQKFI